jgi:hypothetical protein
MLQTLGSKVFFIYFELGDIVKNIIGKILVDVGESQFSLRQ